MGRKKAVQEVTIDKDASIYDEITSHFGKDILFSFGLEGIEKNANNFISTGNIGLDLAVSGYGIPLGQITELYGKEAAGKSSLTYSIISQAQRSGGSALYIDTEHAIDIQYAKTMGVDLSKDKLLISQPQDLEQCLDLIDLVAKLGKTKLICLDSLAGIAPRAELAGTIEDHQVGTVQRLLAKFFRMTAPILSKNGVSLLITNQMRANIGVMYGPTTTTYGGNAIKHHASVRMEVSRLEIIKQGDNPIGQRSRVKISKNKVGNPFREAEIVILFGKGLSLYDDLKEVAVELGTITLAGTYLKYNEQSLGNGRDNVNAFFKENPALLDEIKTDIIKRVNMLA